uniref:ABSCISIC ACID-INSENSITIVE 5-like protein 5 n=1 Tax=Elaeis guineensis var. tenera TaxID=51953 RepID=A0A6I9SC69_ELAGV|nr:ABSCISIC ACID-INSENSITIVE 5-like protein 5 [Elaeis guineensis]
MAQPLEWKNSKRINAVDVGEKKDDVRGLAKGRREGGEGVGHGRPYDEAVIHLLVDPGRDLEHDVLAVKPDNTFGSMNMDEFLANIWNVKEGQIVHAVGSEVQPNGGGVPPSVPLQRQGSITISALLCRKMVARFGWRSIGVGKSTIHRSMGLTSDDVVPHQLTLEKMMLKDFLIKVEVVREGYHQVVSPSPHTPPSLIPWPML